MKNKTKEMIKFITSLCCLILYGYLFMVILYNGVINYGYMTLLGVFIALIIAWYNLKYSSGYFWRYFRYKTKIENYDEYYVENKKKYNKFGSYFLNRPVLVDGDKYSKGNWSIDFEKKDKFEEPLSCKTDGKNYIVL